jgi:hypothetical protein
MMNEMLFCVAPKGIKIYIAALEKSSTWAQARARYFQMEMVFGQMDGLMASHVLITTHHANCRFLNLFGKQNDGNLFWRVFIKFTPVLAWPGWCDTEEKFASTFCI